MVTPTPTRSVRRGDRALRIAYAANLIGAGVPGAVLLAAPSQGTQLLFAVESDPLVATVLGAVWVAIAGVSAIALRDPRRWTGVLAVQVAYKGLWVVAGAVPLLAGGQAPPATVPLAAFFLVIVAAWVVALRAGGRD